LARRKGLLLREVAGELVVYDLERHTAHCLNPAAALVFKQSDGRASVADLARRLHAELALPDDARLVRLALEQLDRARLLDRRPSPPPDPPGCPRREVVQRMALGLCILLPAVTSILVPTSAEAAATCIQATSCTGSAGSPCYGSIAALCDGSCTCQPGACSSDCCDSFGNDCSF
jgi:hypothetical protein